MKFGVSVRHAPDTFLEAALRSPAVDYIEIAGEEFAFRADLRSKQKLKRLLDSKPAAVHGYSLSLLDPAPWSEKRISTYFTFVRSHPFLNLSDHYAISSWNGRHLGALTPAPTGGAANAVLQSKLSRISSELPDLPFLLENVAAPFIVNRSPATNSLVAHFSSALAGTHASLLLDLSNLVANETNFGIDAEDELKQLSNLPIKEIHLAGGTNDNGFFRDSHGSPVNDRTWQLLKLARDYISDECLVLIEREQNHPDWKLIEGELNNARRIIGV